MPKIDVFINGLFALIGEEAILLYPKVSVLNFKKVEFRFMLILKNE